MSSSSLFRIARWPAAILATLLCTTVVQAQQSSLQVRVVDRTTRPVADAQVGIAGTLIGGVTNSEGRITLRNIPLGPQTVRVLRVGYAEAKQLIRVTGAEMPPLDITIVPVAVDLSPVVITATGTQLRKEVGNAVATINVAQTVQVSPITTVADLLAARTSNLVVTTGTQTGSGSRTRIRGVASMSLSN
jgi:hypothetical protein